MEETKRVTYSTTFRDFFNEEMDRREKEYEINKAKVAEKKVTARNMLKKNYNVNDISEVTGLSENAIHALM